MLTYGYELCELTSNRQGPIVQDLSVPLVLNVCPCVRNEASSIRLEKCAFKSIISHG
jgi:hypothetical protein